MTGEDDLDLLVERFIEVEDRNFALFNYVNEQNNEIEKLNEEIQSVSTNFDTLEVDSIWLDFSFCSFVLTVMC